ncbi:MAG: transcription initiation factor IIE subunit alpha [Acidilobaceae archaeon]|nr:transcription initiation factor IIE subunit alpha [Acidilobaceae archaeon]
MKSIERFIERLAISNEVDPQKAKHVFRLVLEASFGNDKGLSDVELEEITGYKQQDVRKILRMFAEAKMMISSKRKLPPQELVRYYWRVDIDSINLGLLKRKRAVVSKLKYRLEHEMSAEFYVCPLDGSRYSFSEAFDYEFSCPRCGAVLERNDNQKAVEELRRFIKELEQEIEEDERKIYSS